jgi:serine/threonine-protein kinase
MSAPPSISGHRIERLLGEGGMGRVYLAEDVVLGRRAAVKVLSARMAGEPDARARFLREARAMAALEHPRVVRVYSFGEADGAPYLVMEYVSGEPLSAPPGRATPRTWWS